MHWQGSQLRGNVAVILQILRVIILANTQYTHRIQIGHKKFKEQHKKDIVQHEMHNNAECSHKTQLFKGIDPRP